MCGIVCRVTFTIEPPTTHPANQYPQVAHFVEFLRTHPGQWAAMLPTETRDQAAGRTRRARRKYGQLGFTFVTRKTPAGFVTYGRYTPTPQVAPTHAA